MSKSCKNLCNLVSIFIFYFLCFPIANQMICTSWPKKNDLYLNHISSDNLVLYLSCGEKSRECHLSDSLYLISFLKDSIFHGIILFSIFSAFFLQNKKLLCIISVIFQVTILRFMYSFLLLFLGSRIGRLWVIWTVGVVELSVRTCQSTLIDLYFAFWGYCNYRPMLHWLFSLGVLEADFVQPSHNKQDFERTSLFQKLEVRLKEMTWEYW